MPLRGQYPRRNQVAPEKSSTAYAERGDDFNRRVHDGALPPLHNALLVTLPIAIFLNIAFIVLLLTFS